MADIGEKVYVAKQTTLEEAKAILDKYADGGATIESVLEKLSTIIGNTDEVESGLGNLALEITSQEILSKLAQNVDIMNGVPYKALLRYGYSGSSPVLFDITGKGIAYNVAVGSGYTLTIDGQAVTTNIGGAASSGSLTLDFPIPFNKSLYFKNTNGGHYAVVLLYE